MASKWLRKSKGCEASVCSWKGNKDLTGAPQPAAGSETALKRQGIDRPSLARRVDKSICQRFNATRTSVQFDATGRQEIVDTLRCAGLHPRGRLRVMGRCRRSCGRVQCSLGMCLPHRRHTSCLHYVFRRETFHVFAERCAQRCTSLADRTSSCRTPT